MPKKPKYRDKRTIKAQDALRQLAAALQGIADSDHAFEFVDPEVARWAADGLKKYLAGLDGSKKISLERALDLTSPGRPRKPATAEELDLGREIFDLQMQQKTWEQIAEAVNLDSDRVRELWYRIEPDVNQAIATELTERLNRSAGSARKPRQS